MTGPIDKELWSRIHAEMPILCVDLCIVRDDRILLLKRTVEPDLGRYWLPGGRLLKLESLHEAAMRLAKRETGLAIEIEGFVGYTNLVFEHDPFGHGKKTHTASLVFRARPISTEVKLDENHSEHLWWDGVQTFMDIPSVVRDLVGLALRR